jgi:hypothetical protein
LQSLLQTSRQLTGSKQHLFPSPPPAPAPAPDLAKRKASRSLSYTQAIDTNTEYQETHFPYSPAGEVAVSTSLLCDKPENRQSGRSPGPDASPQPLRGATFLTHLEEEGEAGEGVAALKELGEALVAEGEEEGGPRPGSSLSCLTERTLCESSLTEMVDTDSTAGRDRSSHPPLHQSPL